ncbi:hypothetical protein K8I28_17525 [bacterium]|nr:hypothetical protein [bacterium]
MRIFASAILLTFILSNLLNAGPVEILFTTSSDAQIENCHCPFDPLGAMEKRSYEINRRRQLGDLFLLDSGDFMPEEVDAIKASATLDIMEHTRYDAVTLGDQELLQGEKQLSEIVKRLPVVATNLMYNNGIALAKQQIELHNGDEIYLILSVIEPSLIEKLPGNLSSKFKVSDPVQTINEIAGSIHTDTKIIVLCHSSFQARNEYMKQWKGIDLVIGGHTEEKTEEVKITNGIAYIEAGSAGRYLGVAQFRRSRVRAELIPIRPELPDDPVVVDRILRYKSEYRKVGKN